MTGQPQLVARLDAELGLIDGTGLVAAPLLPSRLARAAATVLDVDGASLSLKSLDLRVPLGASSSIATRAERLQFTLGEGPCLDVMRGGPPTRTNVMVMARSYPLYHRELTTITPFRSIVAVPLPFTADGDGGALDLYLDGPDDSDRVDLGGCVVVASRIVELLIRAISPFGLAGTDDATKVPWLHGADTRARMEVWVAIGMLVHHLEVEAPDALALMRAWSHTHETDLDRTAALIVGGGLEPDLLGR